MIIPVLSKVGSRNTGTTANQIANQYSTLTDLRTDRIALATIISM